MGVPHPAAMIRRDVFATAGSYCKECLRGQDPELFLRISDRYEMANLEEEILLYRGDPRHTSFSFSLYLHLLEEYPVYRHRCLGIGRQPEPFARWRKRGKVWCKMLAWHTLRFAKAKLSSKAKW